MPEESLAQVDTVQSQEAPAAVSDPLKNPSLLSTKVETETQDPNKDLKSEDQSKSEEGEKPPEDKAKDTVPDKYEFKFEGMEIDQEVADKFTPLAKELGLSQEKAQQIAGLGESLVKKTIERVTQQNAKAWQEERDNWVKTAKSDPEIGGAKFNETLERSHQVIRKYSDKQGGFQKLMDMGFGDNPELIRMLAKIGKDLGEDQLVEGKSTNQEPIQNRLYKKQ